MSSAAFQKAFAELIDVRMEGAYVDNQKDPGGATKYGITQRLLDNLRRLPQYAAMKLPTSVIGLTTDQASAIYDLQFWTPMKLDTLPAALAGAVFKYAVNMGEPRAVECLQRSLGIVHDGIIGDQTAKIAAAKRPVDAVVDFIGQCLKFQRSLSTWTTFADGWTQRALYTAVAATL